MEMEDRYLHLIKLHLVAVSLPITDVQPSTARLDKKTMFTTTVSLPTNKGQILSEPALVTIIEQILRTRDQILDPTVFATSEPLFS